MSTPSSPHTILDTISPDEALASLAAISIGISNAGPDFLLAVPLDQLNNTLLVLTNYFNQRIIQEQLMRHNS